MPARKPVITFAHRLRADEWEEDEAGYGTFDLRAALNFYCEEADSIMVGVKIDLDWTWVKWNRSWHTRSMRL